jgi:hypothetical protein
MENSKERSGSRVLKNFGNNLPNYRTSHPRRTCFLVFTMKIYIHDFTAICPIVSRRQPNESFKVTKKNPVQKYIVLTQNWGTNVAEV